MASPKLYSAIFTIYISSYSKLRSGPTSLPDYPRAMGSFFSCNFLLQVLSKPFICLLKVVSLLCLGFLGESWFDIIIFILLLLDSLDFPIFGHLSHVIPKLKFPFCACAWFRDQETRLPSRGSRGLSGWASEWRSELCPGYKDPVFPRQPWERPQTVFTRWPGTGHKGPSNWGQERPGVIC